jgi:hypothetical protein
MPITLADLGAESVAKQWLTPVPLSFGNLWLFRDYLVRVPEPVLPAEEPELLVRIKHAVLREEKAFTRLRQQVQAFETFERAAHNRREPIPEEVRMFVWRRDEGKCVRCGSRQRLEFDHIIPVAEGGSTSERNIELLCEVCNREKGKRI